METIDRVVSIIVRECDRMGVSPPVDETLAAFVSRMIVYENPEDYPLDSQLGEDVLGRLADAAVAVLTEDDSPRLDTIRMQAALDTAYFGNQAALEDGTAARASKLHTLETGITSAAPKAASDFDARTSLYRKIFQYVVAHAGGPSSPDADVQREVAAALESVFPRVGLKSFVSLSTDEKVAQLNELAHLILGIRIFNWEIGKGGAGITDVPSAALKQATGLEHDILGELEGVAEVCQQYVDVLAPSSSSSAAPSGDKAQLSRWRVELANRRQLSSYLGTLADDLRADFEELKGNVDGFRAELDDLKRLVGSRASVPKEQVYPKFHSLSVHWLSVAEMGERIAARKAVHDSLAPFVSPAVCTLHLDTVRAARDARATRIPHSDSKTGDADASTETAKDSPTDAETKDGGGAGAGSGGGGGGDGGDGDDDTPVRLSLESSPEFMQLPLEYQGYCIHTLVTRDGLLLPGDPSLGVVRYAGRYTVFATEEGLQAYMKDPDRFSAGVVEVAKKSPELVHLLQLQAYFPQASLATIIRGDAPAAAAGTGAGDGPAVMVDKGTETPVHFVEKHIDPRYRWNEWDMRRDALKLANLKKARTVSVQSNLSFFRRENDSQVYLPKGKATQTGIHRGTNPPRKVAYMAGLRGTGPALKKGGVRDAPTVKPSREVYSFDV